jgi:hypothetical protein
LNALFEIFFWDSKKDGEATRRFQAREGYRVRSLCAHCNNGVCGPYAAQYVNLALQLADQGPNVPGTLHTYFVNRVDRL